VYDIQELHDITSKNAIPIKYQPFMVIQSPAFHADGDDNVKWRIHLLPNGVNEEKKGWISAFLHPKIEPAFRPPFNVKFTFTAVSDKLRNRVWSKVSERTFGPNAP